MKETLCENLGRPLIVSKTERQRSHDKYQDERKPLRKIRFHTRYQNPTHPQGGWRNSCLFCNKPRLSEESSVVTRNLCYKQLQTDGSLYVLLTDAIHYLLRTLSNISSRDYTLLNLRLCLNVCLSWSPFISFFMVFMYFLSVYEIFSSVIISQIYFRSCECVLTSERYSIKHTLLKSWWKNIENRFVIIPFGNLLMSWFNH